MKVLIGYDGSESAKAVLDELKRAGLPADTEILAATVVDVWMPPGDVAALPAEALTSRRVAATLAQMQNQAALATETARETAREAAAQIAENFPQWRVRAECLQGNAAHELIHEAADWEADLIVVGSQNRSAMARIFLGSVSRKVVTDAGCSVRVAREPLSLADPDAPQRIVAGIDSAESAELLTDAIARREWARGSVLMLLTATSDAEKDGISPVKQITDAQEFQQSAKLKLEQTGLKILTKIEMGDAKNILLAQAETLAADCIFVGSRNIRGAINRFLVGSVSTAVITNALCSVEVVRAREF